MLKPVFKPRLLQPLRSALATGPSRLFIQAVGNVIKIKRKIGPKTIRFPFNGFDFKKNLNHFNFLTSKKSAVFRMKKLNKNFVSKNHSAYHYSILFTIFYH